MFVEMVLTRVSLVGSYVFLCLLEVDFLFLGNVFFFWDGFASD